MLLPHKKALPLLLASKQLFSTLHKDTSVVVEEVVVTLSLSASLVIPSQPTQTFRLLLSFSGWCGSCLLHQLFCLKCLFVSSLMEFTCIALWYSAWQLLF